MDLKKLSILLSFLLPVWFLLGCEDKTEEERADSNKPRARGALGEILVVIDSAKWAGPVGTAVRDIFREEIKGIIRDEYLFDVRKIEPRSMTRMLKMAYNIVYVTTFDDKSPGSRAINNQFNLDSREMAANDPSLYMLRNKNEFAVGQEVVYLFGANEEQLIQNLKKDKDKIQNLFVVRERDRLANAIFSRKNSAAKVNSYEKMGIKLNLPASYQFVKEEERFLWYRQPTPGADRADISLFFYETDYSSEEQVFPENIIQLRNEITKQHIFGDPADRNSYLVTERKVSPVFRNFSVGGNYAVEMRGAWRTNNLSMGGSFLSYTIIDAEKGKLFYIEGFVYYPNEAHREALREIETILLATEISPDKGSTEN